MVDELITYLLDQGKPLESEVNSEALSEPEVDAENAGGKVSLKIFSLILSSSVLFALIY